MIRELKATGVPACPYADTYNPSGTVTYSYRLQETASIYIIHHIRKHSLLLWLPTISLQVPFDMRKSLSIQPLTAVLSMVRTLPDIHSSIPLSIAVDLHGEHKTWRHRSVA